MKSMLSNLYDYTRLKSARKMAGMSLQDLSDAMTKSGHKISKQALNKLELGGKPTEETFNHLIKVLKIHAGYFYPQEMKIELGEIHATYNGKTVKW